MKERIDILLVNKGLATSREKAKTLIVEGKVYADGVCIKKASEQINEDAFIEIKGEILKYVSRGGLKLEKAIEAFDIKLIGKICMDVGASTGGFTDCMLQNGAKKVYCVDVGHSQLAEKLVMDERVVSMEKTNIRYLTPEDVKEKMDFISIDVSFISLTKVLLPVRELLTKTGEVVALIKPQFEAGKANVGKKGVVKDKTVHIEVITQVIEFAKSIGFSIKMLDFSPIKGPEGNIEYLVHLTKSESDGIYDIKKLVNASHLSL
ncbi:MAG: TlyA family RNA methyltransferase [Lachnospiraceae bacterium]|nr:TlyA family RNA methyltransferase [Lachnospiraceae bacterium]